MTVYKALADGQDKIKIIKRNPTAFIALDLEK